MKLRSRDVVSYLKLSGHRSIVREIGGHTHNTVEASVEWLVTQDDHNWRRRRTTKTITPRNGECDATGFGFPSMPTHLVCGERNCTVLSHGGI